MDKISTYLIHGSLGSGKTSVLNTLIASDIFKQSIIIENEYANYSIDKETIIAETGEIKIFDVTGGCICCSSGQELFGALQKITNEKDIDTLFIETTGVASSVQLMKQLMLSREFDERYTLVRNIFVVDVLEDTVEQMKKQKVLDIAMADIIILNKIDLAPQEKTAEFKLWITAITDAPTITTTYGKVDSNAIVSDTKTRADTILLEHIDTLSNYVVDHSKKVLYQVLYPTKPISEQKLLTILKNPDTLLPMEIQRLKGTFTNTDGKKIFISGTKHNYELRPAPSRLGNDVLVIIGKNVTQGNVQKLLREV